MVATAPICRDLRIAGVDQMRGAIQTLILGVLTIALAASELCAEEGQYKPGFVKDLMKPRPEWGGNLSRVTPPSLNGHAEPAVRTSAQGEFMELEGGAEQGKPQEVEPSHRLQDIPQKPGVPIETLGALIDISDPKAAEQVVAEVVRTIDTYDLIPGQIELLFRPGGQKIDPEKVIAPLAVRGAEMRFSTQVPDEYKITHSPTWIVATRVGRIVLEGFPNITRFLNKEGEFVDLEKSERMKMKAATPITPPQPAQPR